jgi:phosphatidate cytidylyltransferase
MTRILSALLLIPIVVGIVWLLPWPATLALATVAALLACHEYMGLAAALDAHAPRLSTLASVAAVCVVFGSGWMGIEVVLLCAFLLVGTTMVASRRPGRDVLPAASAAALAIVYIGLPLGAIAAVRTLAGPEALLLLMGAIVVSDSAQYYTGRAFGRAPLAPAISPNKTREGAMGGVIFGVVALVWGGRHVFPHAPLGLMAPAAAVIVVLGMFGDLFESLLKRSAGVKDSSALIPGHGGVLDRIDSWLFAGPAYYLLVRYLQP